MEGLGDAISAADTIHNRIHAEVKCPGNKVQNEQEAKESAKARKMAVQTLDSTLSFVQSALFKLRAAKESPSKPAEKNGREGRPSPQIKLQQALPPVAQAFLKAVSADEEEGLGKQRKSLADMATATGPIMDNFDEVLKKPYLDRHSAQLNTVPLLGLKDGNQIMYLAIVSNTGSGSGVSEVWKPFGPLPDNKSASDPSQVHFFPYNGSVFVAVGRSVWRKNARTEGDPLLKEAVDDFSKMYVNDWQKVGDSVLPATDLQSIIPFASLTNGGEKMQFHLLILEKSGTIKVLDKDEIYDNNTWKDLSYSGSDQPPKWTRLAYWNEKVYALDSENNYWELTVNFDQNTYHAADKESLGEVTEFTATDTGLVVTKSDGNVYRRQVKGPTQGSTDPTVEWTQVVARSGVTRLGPASPGVMLNLNALTNVLKSRYIDAQVAVYPVMLKMKTFSRSYVVHIKQVLKSQQEFADAGGDEEKKRIALMSAEQQVENAIIWSGLLNTVLGNSKEEVNAMAEQLGKVRQDLEKQLGILEVKLTGLKRTLEAQQETMSKLKAAFWGMVAGALFGLAMGVIGLFMGANPTVLKAAGTLFVSSVIAAISLGQQMAELAAAMSQTEAEIRVTEQAIDELSSVVQNFRSIDGLYKDMNQFWGRLEDTALEVEGLSETVLAQIATERFKDPSNIVAAQEAAEEIRDATDAYLDALARQGISLPPMVAASTTFASLHQTGPTAFHKLRTSQLDALWHQEVEKGIQLLTNNDHPGYVQQLRNAHAIAIHQTAANSRQRVKSNGWYDIPTLAVNSTIFSLAQGHSTSDSEYERLVSQVRTAATATVRQLGAVTSICNKVKALLDKWANGKGAIAVNDPLLQEALDLCTTADIHAKGAHNGFTGINRTARGYEQAAEREIRRLEDDIQAARRAADEEIANIRYPGWPIMNPELYMLQAKLAIEYRFMYKRWEIEQEIKPHRARQLSGATFIREALTWTQMVETVNSSTNAVSESLQMVRDWIEIDPEYFKELLDEDWERIEQETVVVLVILGQYSSFTKAAISASTTTGPDHSGIVHALCLSPAVKQRFSDQDTRIQLLIAEINGLMQQPLLAGVVGRWDPDHARQVTVQEVLAGVYSSLDEIQTVQQRGARALQLIGSRQRYAAEDVIQGGMSTAELVEYTRDATLPVQRAATTITARWQDLSVEYQASVQLIRLYLSAGEQWLSELAAVTNFENQDARKQAQTIRLVADIIAVTIDTPAQLLPAKATVHVSAALASAKISCSTPKQTSSTLRTILAAFPASDITELITKLTGLKPALAAAVKTLEKVGVLLVPVGEGVEALETATTEVTDRLNMLLEDGNILKQNKLAEEDVKQIMQSWEQ